MRVRVWGSGFGIRGLVYSIWGSVFFVWCFGYIFRAQGVWVWVKDFGSCLTFRVPWFVFHVSQIVEFVCQWGPIVALPHSN